MTETLYSERLVSENPIIGKSKNGWNDKGMHHIDMIKTNDHWFAAVDGQKYKKPK